MPDVSSATETPSFEQALAELQLIVADLENGNVGLEESLARFEQGIKLLKTCYQVLDCAEHRIELLVGTSADGTPLTQAFDASATADAEAPAAGKRRTKRTKSEVTAPAESGTSAPENSDEDSGFLF